MTTRAVAEMDDWDAAPFSGGYAGLRDLADEEFSGVVQSGAAKCCLLNGTVVGVLDGSIEDFEGADGTAYEAPSPALPLLALMQERGDEVKAKYYTEDTPLSEVDDKLSNGGFSGFIELSENVLSGDYYVVYHAGRSMSVAWVGNMGELLTGDEAFERADDEVGIYEVRQVDIEPVEIPEGSDDSGSDAAAAGASAAAASTTGTDAPDDGVATSTADDGITTSTADDGTTTSTADGVGTASEGDPEASSEDAAAGTANSSVDAVEEQTAPDDTAETASAEGTDVAGSSESTTGETSDASGASGASDASTASGVDSPSASGDDSDATEASTATDDGAGAEEPAAGADTPVETHADTDRATSDQSRTEETASDAERGSVATDASTGDTEPRSGGSGDDRRPAGGADESGRTAGESSRPNRSAGADVEETAASTGGTSARPERTGTSDRSGSARTGREESSTDAAGSAGVETGGGRHRESPTRAEADAAGSEDRDAGSGAGSPTERLATRSIPSLDPARTTDDESAESTGAAAGVDRTRSGTNATGTDREAASTAPDSTESSPDQTREASGAGRDGAESRSESGRARGTEAGSDRTTRSPGSGRSAESSSTEASGQAPSSDRVAHLESELEEREAEIDRLESELAAAEEEREDLRRELESVREERDALQSERDTLQSERDALQSERDELASELEDREAELDRVRTELEELEAEFGGTADGDVRLTPSEALDGTNLFVRYESKGKATLESAHGGSASREEVYENLNLELHTQFDAASATVGSQAYDEFLRGTLQYRFVAWVVQELLWEIRDTGKVAALEDLYDAIPKIDRAQLNGVVTVEFTEDGQQRRSEEAFDIVLRDRMGNPLVVTNLNDSRDAASQEMMNSLVTSASRVSESDGSLSAAIFVTSSFFEPEALETAADATSGSLLSRDKRESFVKLSRKRGYHLCLAEARDEQFHLAVPEL